MRRPAPPVGGGVSPLTSSAQSERPEGFVPKTRLSQSNLPMLDTFLPFRRGVLREAFSFSPEERARGFASPPGGVVPEAGLFRSWAGVSGRDMAALLLPQTEKHAF